jgi:hypothetical protein
MHPARLTFDKAPAFIAVPSDLQNHRLEVIFWPLERALVPRAPGRRTPPKELLGKVKELGDVMNTIPPEDWGI